MDKNVIKNVLGYDLEVIKDINRINKLLKTCNVLSLLTRI
jgi:hypothetical protein